MDARDQVPPLTTAAMRKPSVARIYDYWLGGNNNFAVDREVGERAAAAMPTLRAAIHANRAFLRRVVQHLVAGGITQFLDLGSGIPTAGQVHEIALAADPECRVVYVDNDPVAVAHGRKLLVDEPQAAVVNADLRRAEMVLDDPQTRSVLDLRRPIAVLMIAVLHFVPDDEHPEKIVAAYRDTMCPDSFLALTHAAPDLAHPHEQAGMVMDYTRATGVQFIHREPDQLEAWLDGFTVQEPGIVQVNEWHPDPGQQRQILRTFGLLARRDG